MKTKFFILILFATASISHAAIDWDIYSDATIEPGDDYYDVTVHDSLDIPPVQTTVDMLGGNASSLYSYDTRGKLKG